MVMKHTFCLLARLSTLLCFTDAVSATASPAPPAGAVFSAPITKNGVVFEAWVSSHTITVPKDDRTFTLGLRITNHTRQPLRFSAYDDDMPFPKILASNGNMVKVNLSNARKAMHGPETTDYLLATPGASVMITETGILTRNGKTSTLLSGDEIGPLWTCKLRAGNYRLLFHYYPRRPSVDPYVPSSKTLAHLKDLWTGAVKTNPVSFWLVNK